ncbi:MAG: SDR family oxidoreductase [Alphaproteobacteria bacterium]|nr:SDR family oxidoreductase [Alphaproteobacteria bacterium]
MKIDLTAKSAVITGSTGGIGHAIARGLAAAGAAIVLNGRHPDDLDDAVGRLRDAVPTSTVRAVAADLGTAEGCRMLLAAIPATDILINNVGIYEPHDFFETTDEEWDHIFAVNVMSGVRLARAYLPGMATRRWGRVIFVSSESALNIPVEMIHYGLTKTAQLALSRGLAKLLAGSGVTVNAILPGPTLSDGVQQMLRAEADRAGQSIEEAAHAFVRRHRPSSIIRRAATVDEVANLAVYLASTLSSATTGAALRVDGGIVDTIT